MTGVPGRGRRRHRSPTPSAGQHSERDGTELGAVWGSVRGYETGLLYRETTGTVPQGTRQVEVTLDASWARGFNDGYADNLSLVISQH